MTFPRVWLVVAGLVCLTLGVGTMVSPDDVAGLMKIGLDKIRSTIEFQATFGGLSVGLGLFFLTASARTRWIRAGLGAVIFLLGSMAIARLAGLILGGRRDGVHLGYIALDVAGALITMIPFRRAKFELLNQRGHF
jgi:Domain of unknown function (DUF4345)